MEFQQVIRRRRMVRNFSDEPIDRAVIERIDANAQRAPSAGFSQGQRLVIPVGHPLQDKRSPSLKRGWVPTGEFLRWEGREA